MININMSFYEFYNSIINENLVLKKRPIQLDDGSTVYEFIVDSDIENPRDKSNETYKNKDNIKKAGFVWNKNIGKWTSSEKFSLENLQQGIAKYKRAILSINKDFNAVGFDDYADDLEEFLDLGITDKLKEFFTELKEKIKNAKDSPEVKAFFEFRKNFTNRSFNNQMLIFMQNRGATHVEGKKTWETKFGRRLKLGAKSIKIFVPIISKDKKNEDAPQADMKVDETQQLKGFTIGNVYDISDTVPIEGKEHMYVQEPKWYDDATPDEKTRYLYDALVKFAEEHNVQVSISDEGLGGARGVSRAGSIQLMQENISTMIHELTHEILHPADKRKELSSEIKELQAEGVTYLVLKHYGLPTSHAEIYLALWEKDPENVKQNEEIIRDTAKMFIEYIDNATMNSSEESPIQESYINSLKAMW